MDNIKKKEIIELIKKQNYSVSEKIFEIIKKYNNNISFTNTETSILFKFNELPDECYTEIVNFINISKESTIEWKDFEKEREEEIKIFKKTLKRKEIIQLPKEIIRIKNNKKFNILKKIILELEKRPIETIIERKKVTKEKLKGVNGNIIQTIKNMKELHKLPKPIVQFNVKSFHDDSKPTKNSNLPLLTDEDKSIVKEPEKDIAETDIDTIDEIDEESDETDEESLSSDSESEEEESDQESEYDSDTSKDSSISKSSRRTSNCSSSSSGSKKKKLINKCEEFIDVKF